VFCVRSAINDLLPIETAAAGPAGGQTPCVVDPLSDQAGTAPLTDELGDQVRR
jgi:hypothetical protein